MRELLQPLLVVLAVGFGGGDRDGDGLVDLEVEYRAVEAGNDLTRAYDELQRLAPLAAVELGSVGQGTSVVHLDGVAGLGCH